MLSITNAASFARALDSPIDEHAKAVLRLRLAQLLQDAVGYDIGNLAHFILPEPGDTAAAIEAAAGYPVVTANAFEWVADHGGLFEAVTIMSDDGFAVVLLVRDVPATDAGLLALLRKQATPAEVGNTVTDRERPTVG